MKGRKLYTFPITTASLTRYRCALGAGRPGDGWHDSTSLRQLPAGRAHHRQRRFRATTMDETPSATFSRADKALYHAKGHGRNQVVHFDALIRAGLVAEAKIEGDIELF